MKLKEAAQKVEEGINEALTYTDFPYVHWTKLRSNNLLERMNRKIRRRNSSCRNLPGWNSALRLVCARLRHVAGKAWGTKRYMGIKHRDEM